MPHKIHTIRSKFKLEELVTEFPLVTHVISQIKFVFRHILLVQFNNLVVELVSTFTAKNSPRFAVGVVLLLFGSCTKGPTLSLPKHIRPRKRVDINQAGTLKRYGMN